MIFPNRLRQQESARERTREVKAEWRVETSMNRLSADCRALTENKIWAKHPVGEEVGSLPRSVAATRCRRDRRFGSRLLW